LGRKPEEVRERGVQDVEGAQVDRADEDARQQRRREENGCADQPHQRLRSTVAIVWTNCTTRGPQRDATGSSTATTECVRTAAMFDQHARLGTEATLCQQQRVSASTISAGLV